MVRHRREARLPRDDRPHAVTRGEARALEDERLVVAEAVRGAKRRDCAGALVDELARVGHLAAAVRVERRLAQLRQEEPVAELLDRRQLGEHVRLLVADELAAEAGLRGEVGGALEIALLAAGARDLAVPLHQLAEAVDVDRLPALLGELLRQLDREAVGRGQGERVLGGDRLLARRARRRP